MKKINIPISNELNFTEFIKCISFISQEIIDYKVYDDKIEFICNNNSNTDELKKEIERVSLKYKKFENEKINIWEAKGDRKYQKQIIENEQFFSKFNNGMIGLNNESIFLYKFFEKNFEKMALDMGAVKKIYPVLLDVNKYQKTGYLKNSPQYAMFCCDVIEEMKTLEKLNSKIDSDKFKDMLNNPKLALSPSACFHVYIEQENKVLDTNTIFTFTQNVFRNEGRFNYVDLERLRDYHVREIVFIGDESFVKNSRNKMLDKVKYFLEKLNLFGEISVASDPFIIPKMQKFKKIQLVDECKYELKLNLSEEKSISVASFNLHGTAFTCPFNISIKNCEDIVTGCVGFGLERWIIAFLSQFGFDHNNWPEVVKKSYYLYQKKR